MVGTKDTRQAAMCVLNNLDKEIATINFRINSNNKDEKSRVGNWIEESWLIELQLALTNKESLEKQIIENEFDF